MNTEPHTHYCGICSNTFACPWAADGGCIFPSSSHITCIPCSEKAHALTPIAELEPHKFFRIPERTFREGSPRYGRIAFARVGSTRDARGRETSASIELVSESFAGPLPTPICLHSPTGLEWGYGGSGPADCAANILALFVSLPEAWRLHQRFKDGWIAGLPAGGGTMSVRSVRLWLEEVWAKEKADPEAMRNEAELRRLVEQIGQEDAAELAEWQPDKERISFT